MSDLSNGLIPVYPNIKKSIDITAMQISVMDLVLFKSASFRIVFYSGEVPVDVKVLTLDETNGYLDWKTDDFIQDWVKRQLSLGKYA